jgi:curved DNA-binding protein CbpA
LSRESLQEIRNTLAGDILRTALLWNDGHWAFDQRVRVAGDVRIKLDLGRMLLECARHLPLTIVRSRFKNMNAAYLVSDGNRSSQLKPAEEVLFSRATAAEGAVRLPDLAVNGLSEEDVLRGVYGLMVAGYLERTDGRPVFNVRRREKRKPRAAQPLSVAARPEEHKEIELTVDQFLERTKAASDHYEVLGVPRAATIELIKDSYHMLARRFHPDRFHQQSAALRNRIDTAFARIAQAHEILSDTSKRDDYDQKLTATTDRAPAKLKDEPPPAKPAAKVDENRPEAKFRQGMDALKRDHLDEAIRSLGEAARLEPGQARYRAHYGAALTQRPDTRRLAETELKAALAIEPDNSSFRLMLAELYEAVGLRRRAQNEATRVLAADPKNEAARTLLSNLKKK